jgi:hypothetical protein
MALATMINKQHPGLLLAHNSTPSLSSTHEPMRDASVSTSADVLPWLTAVVWPVLEAPTVLSGPGLSANAIIALRLLSWVVQAVACRADDSSVAILQQVWVLVQTTPHPAVAFALADVFGRILAAIGRLNTLTGPIQAATEPSSITFPVGNRPVVTSQAAHILVALLVPVLVPLCRSACGLAPQPPAAPQSTTGCCQSTSDASSAATTSSSGCCGGSAKSSASNRSSGCCGGGGNASAKGGTTSSPSIPDPIVGPVAVPHVRMALLQCVAALCGTVPHAVLATQWPTLVPLLVQAASVMFASDSVTSGTAAVASTSHETDRSRPRVWAWLMDEGEAALRLAALQTLTQLVEDAPELNLSATLPVLIPTCLRIATTASRMAVRAAALACLAALSDVPAAVDSEQRQHQANVVTSVRSLCLDDPKRPVRAAAVRCANAWAALQV